MIDGVVVSFTLHVYDLDDEGRISDDDAAIGYDWLAVPHIT